jgi:hypothetical protein
MRKNGRHSALHSQFWAVRHLQWYSGNYHGQVCFENFALRAMGGNCCGAEQVGRPLFLKISTFAFDYFSK